MNEIKKDEELELNELIQAADEQTGVAVNQTGNDIAPVAGGEVKANDEELVIAELINVADEQLSVGVAQDKEENIIVVNDSDKFFSKYKIKDIVFLAIITACTLVTGAIMPLLVNAPVFGIIQLGLGLQFSIFPVIGMLKVRKPFALILQSVFISIFLVFMFPPMVFIIVCALVAELIALLIFRGYKNDWSCVLAGTLYMPLTIPLLFMYYKCFYNVTGEEKAAVSMFIGSQNIGAVIGISIAVVAVCFIGSVIGMIIARELKKAGKLK